MLADLLQEVAELKRTIEKNENVLLKKSYWENHLSRKIEKLKEENKKLRQNYYNLSKIVETTGGYKASYVNELRDKIAKLEKELEIYKKQYKHTMGGD